MLIASCEAIACQSGLLISSSVALYAAFTLSYVNLLGRL